MPARKEHALLEGKEWEDFEAYATAKSTPEEDKDLDRCVNYYLRHCKV